jgi:hypothetical protein
MSREEQGSSERARDEERRRVTLHSNPSHGCAYIKVRRAYLLERVRKVTA